MLAATDAFKLSTFLFIGILIKQSLLSFTNLLTPEPSLPITSATFLPLMRHIQKIHLFVKFLLLLQDY